jgi:hypothetical protein
LLERCDVRYVLELLVVLAGVILLGLGESEAACRAAGNRTMPPIFTTGNVGS